ncbi:MAG TPA: hypothetical protein DCP53_01185 [Elusimicrobia bacterium]|nr:hypothetical protein [Elusimicrobiota bacterium]
MKMEDAKFSFNTHVEGYNERLQSVDFLDMYLNHISFFCFSVAEKLGYFFRGAITIGQYYQQQILNQDNIFIFSQSLANAVILEEKAKYPRVIISDILNDYLQEKNSKKYDDPIIIFDKYAVRCLNLYRTCSSKNNKHQEQVKAKLEKISDNIKRKMNTHRNEPDVMEKYIYLVEQYNNCVGKIPSMKDMQINIQKY